MKAVAIVQARMGSSRFPNKVMQPIDGEPLIAILLERLSKSQEIAQIVVATSDAARDTVLAECVRSLGYASYQGSEDDVLDRFRGAAGDHNADIIVRITGDCPLVDAEVVDALVRDYRSGGVDYVSNAQPPTFPDGIDVEVFSRESLERAWRETQVAFDREHVTPFIRESGSFRTRNVASDVDHSAKRWTVDAPEDLEVIRAVFAHFKPRRDFSWREVLKMQEENPASFEKNSSYGRNEGATQGRGQKLWQRAKRVIPGGNMLLSKRSELHLPGLWPSYFSRAKGIKVWDLDGTEYLDFHIMGVGTNTLGYGQPEVDAAVAEVVRDGNMSTLNCPEEVYLAERLVELHPWSDMVRFARTGGEINAVAIRIARAATGREKIAFCGYHGWHDWYLAANLSDGTNLAGHLLPGLQPNGVPQNLSGSVLPFNYNRIDELEQIMSAHDVAAVVMEVSRNMGPEDDFLHKVRDLASRRGAVLLFDECTSGFRQTFGGLHKLYGVDPDLATFGKALGNGYAVTALVGRRAVMEAAQSTFISSTFWTERIGAAAGLKTLEVMERERSWETITARGLDIRKCWQELAAVHGLAIDLWGLPALSGFTIKSHNAQVYKTLITQEMLAKGYLAANCVYTCTQHTPELIDAYVSALDPVFGLIAECEDGRDLSSLLKGPVAHSGFRRLN